MTEPTSDSGAPWITDPAEREAFTTDLQDALAKDLASLPKPKRQVSYNQDAVLCPACTKRIRLNNSGRLRVHMSGKMGSDKCMGSNAEPLAHPITFADIENSIAQPKPTDPAFFQKDEPEPMLFSDLT